MINTMNSRGRYCKYNNEFYVIDRYKSLSIVLRRINGQPDKIDVPNELNHKIIVLLLTRHQKYLLNNRIFFDDFINDLCFGKTKEEILELYNDFNKITEEVMREVNDYTRDLLKELHDRKHILLKELTKMRIYTRVNILKRSRCACGSTNIVWYGDRLDGILYDDSYYVVCKDCKNLLEIKRKHDGFQRNRTS